MTTIYNTEYTTKHSADETINSTSEIWLSFSLSIELELCDIERKGSGSHLGLCHEKMIHTRSCDFTLYKTQVNPRLERILTRFRYRTHGNAINAFTVGNSCLYEGHPKNNESCGISREPWYVAYWNFTCLWYRFIHTFDTKMNAIAWRHTGWRHSDWRHILDSVRGSKVYKLKH